MSGDVRRAVNATMREKDIQQALIDAARAASWLVYHTYDSRRSEAGFPDLTLVHAGRGEIAFIECKGSRGVVSHEQRAWLGALDEVAQHSGGIVTAGIANPDTYDSWLTFITRGR